MRIVRERGHRRPGRPQTSHGQADAWLVQQRQGLEDGPAEAEKVKQFGASHMPSRVTGTLLATVLLLVSAPAIAAESGLPVGDLVFKPGIRVGLVYDSNVEKTFDTPEGDIGLEARPYLGVVYPGENFRWELNVHYRLFSYFNIGADNHDAYQVFDQFGFGTSFDVNRKGKVGFKFAPEVYNRPFRQGPADAPDHQLGVLAPIELRFRPSKAFDIGPVAQYEFKRVYRAFTPFMANPPPLAQQHEVFGGLSLDWRFFPRSHMLVQAHGGGILFDEDVCVTGSGLTCPDTNVLQDGGFFRVRGGVKGDITRKVSLMVLGGYGSAIFPDAQARNLTAENGILASVELGLRPITTQRFGFGFDRDFEFKHFSTWVVDNDAYFKYKGLFFGRLGGAVDFTYTFRQFGNTTPAVTADGDGTKDFEHQFTAGVQLELMILEWLHVDASYTFSMVNFADEDQDQGEYIASRVLFGVTFGFR